MSKIQMIDVTVLQKTILALRPFAELAEALPVKNYDPLAMVTCTKPPILMRDLANASDMLLLLGASLADRNDDPTVGPTSCAVELRQVFRVERTLAPDYGAILAICQTRNRADALCEEYHAARGIPCAVFPRDALVCGDRVAMLSFGEFNK